MRKISLLLIMFVISLVALSYAQDEQLSITTYYPAPTGVYKELRLYPNNSPSECNANNEGAMYYNATEAKLMVCSKGWTSQTNSKAFTLADMLLGNKQDSETYGWAPPGSHWVLSGEDTLVPTDPLYKVRIGALDTTQSTAVDSSLVIGPKDSNANPSLSVVGPDGNKLEIKQGAVSTADPTRSAIISSGSRLALGAGGNEGLIINSAGRVGIGMNPQAPLTVNGGVLAGGFQVAAIMSLKEMFPGQQVKIYCGKDNTCVPLPAGSNGGCNCRIQSSNITYPDPVNDPNWMNRVGHTWLVSCDKIQVTSTDPSAITSTSACKSCWVLVLT
jgi:hypothetical protein